MYGYLASRISIKTSTLLSLSYNSLVDLYICPGNHEIFGTKSDILIHMISFAFATKCFLFFQNFIHYLIEKCMSTTNKKFGYLK